ncbi:MAG TPA: Ig-like domain-containing protein [Rubrobacter sp.]|nr:Ig-like domain-containing protein [Rubrobacter sp.]
MGSGGGGKTNVTDDNGMGDDHPAFSAEGVRNAFNSSRPNGDPTSVHLVGAGGAASRLAASSGFDNDPDRGAGRRRARDIEGHPGAGGEERLPEGQRDGRPSPCAGRGRQGSRQGKLRRDDPEGRPRPAVGLRPGTTYVATGKGGTDVAGDLAGNALPAPTTRSFTVRG